jgi:hypothetical protein
MSDSLTPEQRSLRARLAAQESWARTTDPAARTAPARAAAMQKFLDAVDPEGVLPVEQRQRMAEAARKAYFTRLAFQSSRARSAKAQTQP